MRRGRANHRWAPDCMWSRPIKIEHVRCGRRSTGDGFRIHRISRQRRFTDSRDDQDKGGDAYVFGSPAGELVTNFKTAWESLLLIANGHETARPDPFAPAGASAGHKHSSAISP